MLHDATVLYESWPATMNMAKAALHGAVRADLRPHHARRGRAVRCRDRNAGNGARGHRPGGPTRRAHQGWGAP